MNLKMFRLCAHRDLKKKSEKGKQWNKRLRCSQRIRRNYFELSIDPAWLVITLRYEFSVSANI